MNSFTGTRRLKKSCSNSGLFVTTAILFPLLFILASASITAPDCLAEYQWSENSEGLSPCKVAAVADQLCSNTPDYTIAPLQPGYHYTPPSKTTTTSTMSTMCTCSWAVYNLMSMCGACQTQLNDSTLITISWDAYSADCDGYLTDHTYFPPNITLPENFTFPIYAQVNPVDWVGSVFNITQAQSLVTSNDSIPASTSTSPPTATTTTTVDTSQSNTTPTAAIIGGTLGGVGLLTCIAGAFACWYSRHRTTHGFQSLSSNANIPDHAMTMATHSQRSYFFRHISGSSYPPTRNTSPMPGEGPAGPECITPFLSYHSPQSSLDHTNSSHGVDRRTAKIESMISSRSGTIRTIRTAVGTMIADTGALHAPVPIQTKHRRDTLNDVFPGPHARNSSPISIPISPANSPPPGPPLGGPGPIHFVASTIQRTSTSEAPVPDPPVAAVATSSRSAKTASIGTTYTTQTLLTRSTSGTTSTHTSRNNNSSLNYRSSILSLSGSGCGDGSGSSAGQCVNLQHRSLTGSGLPLTSQAPELEAVQEQSSAASTRRGSSPPPYSSTPNLVMTGVGTERSGRS